ncbi:MAG: LysM peptidoglycan-binding domain-containing protein [Thermodesulfobacteriota bacterium]|nr:LysM peptidoglycan-binding domain-containing protein [Thermodesulfobacteriota bacterium]
MRFNKMVFLLCAMVMLTACSHIQSAKVQETKHNTESPGDLLLPEDSAGIPFFEPMPEEDVSPDPAVIVDKTTAGTPDKIKDETVYTIAFENNARIEYWIKRYTGKNKGYFAKSLYRFNMVRPVMEEIFEEYSVPADMVYLCLIESGGMPNAVSHAGATGYWQFMPQTARHYNLKVDRWIDERRNLEKSTRAAARYLCHLHSIFGDWLLAGAAYNAGEGTICRIQRRHRHVDSFWEISSKMHVNGETLAYIPKFLAALSIAKNMDAYGIDIPPAPEAFACSEKTKVNTFTYLDEIAGITGRSLYSLSRLNPELVRRCTPPGDKTYVLRIPEGSKKTVDAYLRGLDDPGVHYLTHRVKAGDTLYDLSRRYNTSITCIAGTNRMKKDAVLSIGRTLVIPQGTRFVRPRHRHTYVVVRGDTLRTIALHHKVSLDDLIEVNQLRDPGLIQPDMVLNIPPGNLSVRANHIQYKVKRGDTIWGISRRFEVSTRDVMRWNRLSDTCNIYPGDALSIYQ